jgi:lysozyme
MKPRQQISKAAIDLIKRFEGYRRKAAQLPDGRWTIGYGHIQTARAGAEVSEADAEALLIYDLIAVTHAVNERVYTPLTQNQFDALCAFVFNIGVDAFSHSTVLRRLNEGRLIEAAYAMELWRRADFEGEVIVVDALVRRRAAEKTLFLTPVDGWIPAPSALLAPRLDADAAGLAPAQTPVSLRAALTGERIRVERVDAPSPSPVPPANEDEGPVTAAAAAVTARLQALLPDETPKPAAAPVQVQAPAIEAPLPPSETPAETPTLQSIAKPVRSAAKEGELSSPASPPLLLLALVGLVGFFWALYWAFKGEPAANGGGFNPLAVSWFVGVIGIGCFGAAAYLMLERLGGGDSDDRATGL